VELFRGARGHVEHWEGRSQKNCAVAPQVRFNAPVSLTPPDQSTNAVAPTPDEVERSNILIVADDDSYGAWLSRAVAGPGRNPHFAAPNRLEQLQGEATDCSIVIATCRTLDEGTQILAALRIWLRYAPVLILSADVSTEAVVSLLRAGADSALPICSHPSLIRASVEAILRRRESAFHTSCEISLDQDASIVVIGGRRLVLRRASFRLCEYLLRHKERWVSERELRVHALGVTDCRSDSLVRVHVRHLRMALGEYGTCLHSRRFLGYRFVVSTLLPGSRATK